MKSKYLRLSLLAAFVLLVTFSVIHLSTHTATPTANTAWMGQAAVVLLQYERIEGRLPDSIEQALGMLNKTGDFKSDAWGRTLVYERVADHAFFLHSSGLDGKNEGATGDDQLLYYANGHEIPRADFLKWAKANLDADEWQKYQPYLGK